MSAWGASTSICGLSSRSDLEADLLTIPDAEELLAEFFIALNKDSDLYPGVQQGDNGQISDPGRSQA